MLDLDPLHAEDDGSEAEDGRWRRAWTAVASSTLVHLALIAAVLWIGRPERFLLTRPVDSLQVAQRARRQVEMVYLAPPRPRPLPPAIKVGPDQPHPQVPKPPPTPTPPTPPPTPRDRTTTPDAATAPSEGDAVGTTVAPPRDAPVVPAPPVHRMRSLAFHPGEFASPLTRTSPDPVWRQPPDLGTIGNKCVPGPKPVRGPNDPIRYGVVAGRVYRLGTELPLAGADIQVTGTPYRTVSDSNGDYVLRFDADLLANCQVQYVQVTADGFISQNLILSSGPAVRNDINLRASP